MSNDYAIPPDASTDSLAPRSSTNRASYLESPRKTAEKALEKSGYLTKLGGKIKSWHKRYFVLKSGVLSYWKSQVRYYIMIQTNFCWIFNISSMICIASHRVWSSSMRVVGYLAPTAVTHSRLPPALGRAPRPTTWRRTPSPSWRSGSGCCRTWSRGMPWNFFWVRRIRNPRPRWDEWVTIMFMIPLAIIFWCYTKVSIYLQGWLVKVKHGHQKKCWCVLIGKMFIYFRTPNEQVWQFNELFL